MYLPKNFFFEKDQEQMFLSNQMCSISYSYLLCVVLLQDTESLIFCDSSKIIECWQTNTESIELNILTVKLQKEVLKLHESNYI